MGDLKLEDILYLYRTENLTSGMAIRDIVCRTEAGIARETMIGRPHTVPPCSQGAFGSRIRLAI
jgi:hypothetical protein